MMMAIKHGFWAKIFRKCVPDMELMWIATRLSTYSLPLQPAKLSTAEPQTVARSPRLSQICCFLSPTPVSIWSRAAFFSSMQSLKLSLATSVCSWLHLQLTSPLPATRAIVRGRNILVILNNCFYFVRVQSLFWIVDIFGWKFSKILPFTTIGRFTGTQRYLLSVWK